MDVFDRLKAATPADWQSYVDHDFVRQMGAGTLPQAAFRTYLVQDYLFLIQFARLCPRDLQEPHARRHESGAGGAGRDPR